jgi:SAM-dependent methyltransferase
MDEYLENNRKLWNQMVPYHVASDFYDVEGFKRGRCTLSDIELEEVGDVAGKSLLHLQCHFGMDTLSWARRGANVTGIDFSEPAIEQARALASEVGLEATFVCCPVDEAADRLNRTFDIVYTSAGVLCWLPDLGPWARTIARSLEPGGVFYILDGHPMANCFENEGDVKGLDVKYSYFHEETPLRWHPGGSYADPEADITYPSYEWQHTLGDIINALLGEGLRLVFLHELPFCGYAHFPFLEEREGGWWHLPGSLDRTIPMTFSLKARKPA